MNCPDLQKKLPDLLFAQQPLPEDARAHLDICTPCRLEYASFQSTFDLLDSWQAPEPSPYFGQKLAVRLREEVASAPAGWFERLRSRLLFNTGAQFRPILAGAIAIMFVAGGGAFAGFSSLTGHQGTAQVSATVRDLQILDKNDQALQQMDQLLQDDENSDNDATTSPRT